MLLWMKGQKEGQMMSITIVASQLLTAEATNNVTKQDQQTFPIASCAAK